MIAQDKLKSGAARAFNLDQSIASFNRKEEDAKHGQISVSQDELVRNPPQFRTASSGLTVRVPCYVVTLALQESWARMKKKSETDFAQLNAELDSLSAQLTAGESSAVSSAQFSLWNVPPCSSANLARVIGEPGPRHPSSLLAVPHWFRVPVESLFPCVVLRSERADGGAGVLPLRLRAAHALQLHQDVSSMRALCALSRVVWPAAQRGEAA